jgi:hypothetical protein
MKTALSDYLQIWGFNDDTIIFSDGSLGCALEVIPLDVSCWSPGQIDDFGQRVAGFLNGLPDGLDLQLVQDITGGNDRIINQHGESGINCASEIVTELTQMRTTRLMALDTSGSLPRHTLKIFL